MNFTKIILFEKDKPIADFAAARNRLLQQAKGEWVLFLDTDEKMTPALESEIQNLIPKFDGYYLRRDDFFFGRRLKFGETASVKLLRLGKKAAGHWEGKVHEVWKINGKVGELKNPLLHYPHPTIKEFISHINHYTDLVEKKPFSLWETLVYPPAKFLQNYFLRLGFHDGLSGFVVAYLMSLHSLLVRVKSYDISKAFPTAR